MQAAWRLAINNLSGRRSRTLMLVLAVAMSAGLIAAVACAMASLNLAVGERIRATVGSGDLRIRHVGNGAFDSALLTRARAWPVVQLATGRRKEALLLRKAQAPEGAGVAITTWAIDPETEGKIRPFKIVSGRSLQVTGEVVLDEAAARSLAARAR